METRVYADADALAEAVSGLLYGRILAAVESQGNAVVVLSGGGTPRESYTRLSLRILQGRIPVERILWIFADERWVPVTDPQSNEGMIRELLLSPIGAPDPSILSWKAGRGDPAEKARDYERRLRERVADGRPAAAVMGVGADGHTASLFPGSRFSAPDGSMEAMQAGIPMDAAAVLRRDGAWRLTLSPSFLSRSRLVVFLAADAEKRDALERARRGDPAVPASWVRGDETLFMATRDAAGASGSDFGREVRFA